ncbi:MAG: transcription elongation factor GreA [Candidatus Omnitrophota bacterium]|nr:transcription elongation factor GreA [Candidatus Omnitrophota bacterium]
MDRIYLTREGYEKLTHELEHLKNVKRKEIAKALEYARQLGDLRENSEYSAAKEAFSFNEKRIQELEEKLSRAEIIENLDTCQETIRIGCKVKLVDLSNNEEMEYNLVGPDEANPVDGFISIISPVGKALIGHKENDIVEITIPAGVLKCKVVKISH